MAAQRIVLNLAIAVGVLAVSGAAVADEYRGTMEQQMACTPDVFRLCGAQIPDVNRIVGCLRQNTAQLSGPCRAVFETNDSMQQPAAQRPGRPRPIAPGRQQYEDDDQ
jgi:hypothetical protein